MKRVLLVTIGLGIILLAAAPTFATPGTPRPTPTNEPVSPIEPSSVTTVSEMRTRNDVPWWVWVLIVIVIVVALLMVLV
jgi:hypothetical protein